MPAFQVQPEESKGGSTPFALSRPLDVVVMTPQSQPWGSQLLILTYLMKCRWENLHDSLNQSKEKT